MKTINRTREKKTCQLDWKYMPFYFFYPLLCNYALASALYISNRAQVKVKFQSKGQNKRTLAERHGVGLCSEKGIRFV